MIPALETSYAGAGCATHVTFTPWPCATAKALGAEL